MTDLTWVGLISGLLLKILPKKVLPSPSRITTYFPLGIFIIIVSFFSLSRILYKNLINSTAQGMTKKHSVKPKQVWNVSLQNHRKFSDILRASEKLEEQFFGGRN